MSFDKLKELFSGNKKTTTIGDLIVAREKLKKLRVDLVTKLAECDYCLDSLNELIARDSVVQELCSSESDDGGSEDSGI